MSRRENTISESQFKTDEYIEENKDELIENIVNETGLDSDGDREIVEDTINEICLKEKLKHEEMSTDLRPSIYEDFQSTFLHGISSKGQAEIVDITDNSDGTLTLEMSIIGCDDTIKRRYYYTDEKNTCKDYPRPRSELEKIYEMANSRLNNPTDIIGKEIPMKPASSRRIDYKVHYPPSDPGIGRRILYYTSRWVRKYNIIGYDNDSNVFKYKPNNKLYFATILGMFIVYPISSQASFMFLLMLVSLFCFHIVYAIE